MKIRRAGVSDVPAMGQIINDCAEHGLMLHRSQAYLYEHVRDFQVAVGPDPALAAGVASGVSSGVSSGIASGGSSRAASVESSGETSGGASGVEVVLGVCGLNIIWADMAEVYALAVRPSARGRGLGGRLVRACLDEAGTLGIRRQMTLTYEQQFFERLGFRVVDRQQLPLKVWSQCVRCSKNAACDEIAMIHVHESVPACEAAPPPERERYEVPVPLTIRRSLVTGAARPKMDELVEPRRP